MEARPLAQFHMPTPMDELRDMGASDLGPCMLGSRLWGSLEGGGTRPLRQFQMAYELSKPVRTERELSAARPRLRSRSGAAGSSLKHDPGGGVFTVACEPVALAYVAPTPAPLWQPSEQHSAWARGV